MHLFYAAGPFERIIALNNPESMHCTRVLRLKNNAEVGVLDGRGNLHYCRIIETGVKTTRLEILETDYLPHDNFTVHVAISPIKSTERMEWFIEKSVELGIHEITFIQCQRTEKLKINIERIQKKAISALKQSQNRYVPVINPLKNLLDFIEQNKMVKTKYIASLIPGQDHDKLVNIIPTKDNLVLIGPEGDFTEQELHAAVQNGFKGLSLGKNTLRTETAGLAAGLTLILASQRIKGAWNE